MVAHTATTITNRIAVKKENLVNKKVLLTYEKGLLRYKQDLLRQILGENCHGKFSDT